MKTILTVLVTLLLIVWIAIGVGVIQNYYAGDRNCYIYNSSDEYMRYTCNGHTFYKHK
jgi:uncharacterized protein YxeA